uniref:DNA2/NAM7 helicase-like C-terminal domain-containing protein n=1 Tax=Acrobeloides nanus TaxID=290746 RepID=A0A914DCD3_9BILA
MRNPNATFCVTAKSNGAVEAIAESICKYSPRKKLDMLLIQSHAFSAVSSVEEKVHQEWEKYKILPHVRNILKCAKLHDKDEKKIFLSKSHYAEIESYLKEKERNPYLAVSDLKHSDHMPQVFITGDKNQLGPFLPHSAEMAMGIGQDSCIKKMHACRSAAEIVLNMAYQCHLGIVEFYQPGFEEEFVCAVTSEERNLLNRNGICMPDPERPIMFVDTQEKSTSSNSLYRTNVHQQKLAYDLVKSLRSKITENFSIAVVCYYTSTANEIRRIMIEENGGLLPGIKTQSAEELFKNREITVSTVDKFIGKEADICVVVTTRSVDYDDEGTDEFTHVLHNERWNVAASRVSQGLFIVGDKRILLSKEGSAPTKSIKAMIRKGSNFIVRPNDIKRL